MGEDLPPNSFSDNFLGQKPTGKCECPNTPRGLQGFIVVLAEKIPNAVHDYSGNGNYRNSDAAGPKMTDNCHFIRRRHSGESSGPKSGWIWCFSRSRPDHFGSDPPPTSMGRLSSMLEPGLEIVTQLSDTIPRSMVVLCFDLV